MTQAHQEALGASLLLDKPIETPKRLHWKIRLEAFLLCCSLGFGYHFAWHLLGPLKEPIKENLNISNAGFGALQSSLSVLVTITAILGGVIVDRAGCDKAALISTTIVFIGLFIMIIGVSLNIFYGCLLGLAMIGVGGNWVSTAQEASMIRVYPEARGQHKKHPHQSNEVSLAFGSLFSIGKIFSFTSNGIALHLYEWFQSLMQVFLVGLSIAFFSISTALLQWRKRHQWFRQTGDTVPLTTLKSTSAVTSLKERPSWIWQNVKRAWWDCVEILTLEVRLYLLLQFLLDACWHTFSHLSSNMIKVLYQIEAKQAAWIASITMAIPILTNPLVGIFIDRTQRRTWPILFGTGCLLLAFMVMLYPSSHSLIAVIPPILVALSLSCTPLAMVMIAARLMPENRFGTLLGLRSSVGNIGTVWVGSLAGPIQDLSARIQLGPDQGYLGVVRLFVLLSLGAMVMAWLVWYIGRHKMDGDARINHVRTLKRVDVEEEDMLSDEDALALHIVDRDVHRTSYAYPQGNLICAYLLIVMAIGAVVMFAFAIILR